MQGSTKCFILAAIFAVISIIEHNVNSPKPVEPVDLVTTAAEIQQEWNAYDRGYEDAMADCRATAVANTSARIVKDDWVWYYDEQNEYWDIKLLRPLGVER